jgi:hypothetical protein
MIAPRASFEGDLLYKRVAGNAIVKALHGLSASNAQKSSGRPVTYETTLAVAVPVGYACGRQKRL